MDDGRREQRSSRSLGGLERQRVNWKWKAVAVAVAIAVLWSTSNLVDVTSPQQIATNFGTKVAQITRSPASAIDRHTAQNVSAASQITRSPASAIDDPASAIEGSNCLAFSDGVEERVRDARQVFVAMPAKAGGQTMMNFAGKCTGFTENFNFNVKKNFVKKNLLSQDLPNILASHIRDDEALVRLAQTTPSDVLTFFIYREESSRFVSAIKQVVMVCFCQHRCWHHVNPEELLNVTRDKQTCIVEDERQLIENVIKKKLWELGHDVRGILTCHMYDVIDDTHPNMLVLNYLQIDQLQTVLAKRHCPDLLPQLPIHANSAARKEREKEHYVRVGNGTLVPLGEWAESKRHLWHWAIDDAPSTGRTCLSRTHALEEELLSCNDQIIDMNS